jgi:transposase
MWPPRSALSTSPTDRGTLEAWVRAGTTPQRVVSRARVRLLDADGHSNNRIARHLDVSRPTVIMWRERFSGRRPAGLAEDAPHGAYARRLDRAKVTAIVEATLHTKPADATHWSTRSMARAQGVSRATVARIWDAHGPLPRHVEQRPGVGRDHQELHPRRQARPKALHPDQDGGSHPREGRAVHYGV